MIERLAIQFNENTLEKIMNRFPNIMYNYTALEILELVSKQEYLVTNHARWFDFMILTEQEFLMNYGTASPVIEKTFVRVTKVA